MTPERFESLHKVVTVFDKYKELLKSVRSLNNVEYDLLIRSLEATVEDLPSDLFENCGRQLRKDNENESD